MCDSFTLTLLLESPLVPLGPSGLCVRVRVTELSVGLDSSIQNSSVILLPFPARLLIVGVTMSGFKRTFASTERRIDKAGNQKLELARLELLPVQQIKSQARLPPGLICHRDTRIVGIDHLQR